MVVVCVCVCVCLCVCGWGVSCPMRRAARATPLVLPPRPVRSPRHASGATGPRAPAGDGDGAACSPAPASSRRSAREGEREEERGRERKREGGRKRGRGREGPPPPRADPRRPGPGAGAQRLAMYGALAALLAWEAPFLLDFCFLILAYLNGCIVAAQIGRAHV